MQQANALSDILGLQGHQPTLGEGLTHQLQASRSEALV